VEEAAAGSSIISQKDVASAASTRERSVVGVSSADCQQRSAQVFGGARR